MRESDNTSDSENTSDAWSLHHINRRKLFKIGLVSAGAAAGTSIIPVVASAAPTGIPKLGSECSASERAQRAQRLAEARKTYVWSMNVANVEGVPMVANVPLGENPTVDFLIEGINELLKLIENLLESAVLVAVPQLKPAMDGFNIQVQNLKNLFFEKVDVFDDLVKKYDNPTVNTVVDVVDKDLLFGIGDILLWILAELENIRGLIFDSVEKNLAGHQLWIGDFGSKDNLAKYNAMWASTPLPPVSQRLHDDEYFGYSRVAGPNPLVIEKVRGAVPKALAIDEQRFAAAAGMSLAAAQRDGRLFVCDYAMLGTMASQDATYKVLTGPGFNTAPIGLFVLQDSGMFKPVAIQVGQERGHSPVFYPPAHHQPDAAGYWGWEMAKSVFQTADFNHHEMFSHLSMTHLVSEAFCVSMHRQLPKGHPLRVLLEPHFEGDLWVNSLAAAIIMAPLTFAEIILAPELHITKTTAGQARLNWDFTEMMPANEFARRGVDDQRIKYPYRDDALLVWDDIHAWVAEYVKVYYRDDGAVRGDADLRNWVKEVVGPGRIKGFPNIADRETLIEALTMVIFTASAQHAAVNYPQRDHYSYAPYAAGSLASIPTSEREYTAHDWYRMMPTLLGALAQMYFLNLLGGIYYRRLGDYRTNEFPYPPAIYDRRVMPSLKSFRRRLGETEDKINGRNKSRMWAYEYLLPSNIPMSTNV